MNQKSTPILKQTRKIFVLWSDTNEGCITSHTKKNPRQHCFEKKTCGSFQANFGTLIVICISKCICIFCSLFFSLSPIPYPFDVFKEEKEPFEARLRQIIAFRNRFQIIDFDSPFVLALFIHFLCYNITKYSVPTITPNMALYCKTLGISDLFRYLTVNG